LHGDVLVPDLAGWRRTRMPEMPHAAAFERWTQLGVWKDNARVRAEPFEVHEIELEGLWAR
jgi:hypothetical protein